MSIRIIKSGILDSFQDLGRPGFAHLGIGCGGAMDKMNMQLANAIAGNSKDEPVLEMHAPGAKIEFEQPAVVSLCGGDFGVLVNAHLAKSNQAIYVNAGDVITVANILNGRWIYLAVHGGFEIEEILGSASTHLQGKFGGWQGRKLKSGDTIPLKKIVTHQLHCLNRNRLSFTTFKKVEPIRILKGPEFHLLKDECIQNIINDDWKISLNSDRMAYALEGVKISLKQKFEMLSSPVMPGTIQLLPSGKILVLMADAQTVGGYPRILQVAAADISRLTQWPANQKLNFQLIDMNSAVSAQADLEKMLKRITSALHLRFKA